MAEIPALKRIDFEKGYIDGIRHRYYIQNSLSLNRYKEYVKFQHKLAYDATPEEMQKFLEWGIAKLTEPLTGLSIHSFVERMMNMREAYKNAKVGEDGRLMFLTLFLNREDEDIGQWDERLALSKVEDWKDYDIGDFFLLSAKLSPSLRAKYMQSHGLTEEDVQAAEKEMKKSNQGGSSG